MIVRERSTSDLVVIFLAGIIGAYVILSLGAVFYVVITNPDADISASARALSNVVSIIVGAVVGYIGGRVQANGKNGSSGG